MCTFGLMNRWPRLLDVGWMLSWQRIRYFSAFFFCLGESLVCCLVPPSGIPSIDSWKVVVRAWIEALCWLKKVDVSGFVPI